MLTHLGNHRLVYYLERLVGYLECRYPANPVPEPAEFVLFPAINTHSRSAL